MKAIRYNEHPFPYKFKIGHDIDDCMPATSDPS